jgi:hypothetical protein
MKPRNVLLEIFVALVESNVGSSDLEQGIAKTRVHVLCINFLCVQLPQCLLINQELFGGHTEQQKN